MSNCSVEILGVCCGERSNCLLMEHWGVPKGDPNLLESELKGSSEERLESMIRAHSPGGIWANCLESPRIVQAAQQTLYARGSHS